MRKPDAAHLRGYVRKMGALVRNFAMSVCRCCDMSLPDGIFAGNQQSHPSLFNLLNMHSYQKFLRLLVFVNLLLVLFLNGCKKETETPDPVPPKEEEVIPGKTVGYGAIPVSQAEYEKIKLIQEPQIPNGRTLKNPQLPAQYDLSPAMPPVQSQGAQGSCTAWAVSYAARSYFNGQVKSGGFKLSDGAVNNDMVLSPAFVYNQTKAIGCADGSYTARVLEFLKTKGACTWKEMPYNAADCETQPNAQQIASAEKYRIKDWGRIKVEVPVVKKFLYYDVPVIISAKLNADFKRYTAGSDGQYVWKDGTDTDVSYHAMIIVGYDDTRKAFKIQNSWGTSWANKGFIWMNYDILTQVIREAFIMVPNEWSAAAELPEVVTNGSGTVVENQIELKGSFKKLGSLPVIRYGITVSNTTQEPVDQIEVMNTPITSETHAFTVKAAAVGPKLYYRSFAETLRGIVYGEVMSVDVKPTSNPELDKAMLFADSRSVFDPVTGDEVSELPYNMGEGQSITYQHRGLALTKTHIYFIAGSSNNQAVYAYGIVDHKLKWSYKTGKSTYGYIATDDSRLYFTTNESIVALSQETGARVWQYTASHYSGQPIVANGAVYFGVVNKGITAVDAATGKLIREYPERSGRNLATVVNGTLYYITSEGVVAYNTNNGNEVWYYTGPGFHNMNDMTRKPLFADGKLIVSGLSFDATSKIIALDASTGKIAWEVPTQTVQWQPNVNIDAGTIAYIDQSPTRQIKLVVADVSTGKTRWERVVKTTVVNPSATDFNVLVVGTSVFFFGYDNDKVIRSLDARNGAVLWEKSYQEAPSLLMPSLITAAGKVYKLSTMGMN